MTETATMQRPPGTVLSPTPARRDLPGELRAVHVVWKRELIRFLRARTRIVTGLVQPVLFLFVLGGGLSPLVGGAGGLDFRKFVFPGVVAMSVVTTAIFSAVSIVWDREFGFLREMLVAPVSRAALVVGKALGGTTVATLQGTIMLALAPLVGIRITPLMVVEVMGASALMAFALTSFGLLVAGRIKRIESFQVVMQFALFPMLFLSGALFPIHGLPGWLAVLTRFDPVTYAVDPLRRAVFGAQHLGAAATARFGAGVELFGRILPIWSELAIVGVISLIFISWSVREFSRTE
ncbi:MAG TPA: ABC transporter permease [Actinomycetota bacterium]|jgi:ABC-2 type transport system permease protein